MSYYGADDRKELFPSPTDDSAKIKSLEVPTPAVSTQHEDIFAKAVVHAIASTDTTATINRTGVDEMCPGCGMFGHHVYKTGCDRCAQYLLIRDFLEKNPDSKASLISKYRTHQKDRMRERKRRQLDKQKRTTSFKGKPKYNTRSKATLKSLNQEEEHQHSSSDDQDEQFEDAYDDNHSSASTNSSQE